MNNNYFDYDQYNFGDEIDALCYDDGSHSLGRRKELNRRKYSGYDTYCEDYDDGYGDW